MPKNETLGQETLVKEKKPETEEILEVQNLKPQEGLMQQENLVEQTSPEVQENLGELGGLDEPRLVTENGVAHQVARLVAPVLKSLGYRLVRVKISTQDGSTLQIMAERADGALGVNDCEKISRALAPVLDVEDPISTAYNLEISSPGMDRPLVRISDFQRWIGHEIRVEMGDMPGGRKRWRGLIHAVEASHFVLECEDEGDNKEEDKEDKSGLTRLDWRHLREARLMLTDAVIQEALRRNRAAADETLEDENEEEAESDDSSVGDLNVNTPKKPTRKHPVPTYEHRPKDKKTKSRGAGRFKKNS